MPASNLDTELRESAHKTAESILVTAREDAERLGADADRVIGDRRREALKHKEAEYGAEARVAIAAARHAAMRVVLLARTRVVTRVLDRARALLPDTAHDATYLSALGDELNQALQFVDGQGAEVRCSPAVEPAVREALRDRSDVKVATDSNVGTGFVVVGAGGSVEVDGRLETRIERLASVLAIEIHNRLEEP